MNKIIVLALAAGGFIGAPAFAQSTAPATAPAAVADAAQAGGVSYESLTAKAAADYKAAKTNCDAQRGYAKDVCLQNAKVENARAIADAVAQFHNTPADLANARGEVANAQFDLAKAKCGDRNGRDKTVCLADAANVHNAALADAKAGTPDGTMAANPSTNPAITGDGSASADCDALTTTQKAACMSRKGGNVAKTAIDDTVITTRIKADLVKDADLKAMDVHVETVKGVVMLSGFVPTQADIARAEEMARATAGVSDVRNALTVKQP